MASFIGIPISTGSSFGSLTVDKSCRRTPRTYRILIRAQLQNARKPDVNAVPLNWNSLGRVEFDSLLESRALPLCLIGMSNCGKSHWTNALVSNHGFAHMCVDDEIERAFEPELTALGYAGIADMARWMGYPADERFVTNEARYLQIEEDVTSRVIPATDSNFVLDTTGSVVYLSPSTLNYLQERFFIVHLAANDGILDSLRTSYFKSPKPVVWADAYNQLPDESSMDALRRCYDGLLRERLKRYHALAHVSIPAKFSFSPDATVEQFLDLVRNALDAKY